MAPDVLLRMGLQPKHLALLAAFPSLHSSPSEGVISHAHQHKQAWGSSVQGCWAGGAAWEG